MALKKILQEKNNPSQFQLSLINWIQLILQGHQTLLCLSVIRALETYVYDRIIVESEGF